jgi:hypothetical protein
MRLIPCVGAQSAGYGLFPLEVSLWFPVILREPKDLSCRAWTVSTGRVRLRDCEMLPFGQHDRIMHTRHPEGTEGSRLPGGGHFHPAHPIEYLWFIRGGFSIYP